MKQILLTIATLALLSYPGLTQDDATDFRDKVQFGVKAGINLSNVYDTQGEEFNTDPKFGLAAGIFLSVPIGKFIGIQPEILLSQKGYQAEGSLFDSRYVVTRTTNYIDVPLLVTIKPIQYVTLMAGPQYSFLINQKNKFDNGVTTIEQEREFDNENLRRNTLCFTGGLDINVEHLVLGGRVGWDLYKNNGDGTSTTPRYKNVWYQVTIGYRIY